MDRWLEYWQQEELHPDVFTDKKGEKHDALNRFWANTSNTFTVHSRLLDIASGAGAIYRCISNIKDYDAHALDISPDALNLLKADLPSVNTHAQYLDDTSFVNSTFDGIFSQYGIEYLGDKGFKQVPRLLNVGGRCVFLCHIKDGVIDNITRQSLDGLDIVTKTEFLSKSKRVAEAFGIDDKVTIEAAVSVFMEVEPQLAQYCAQVPKGHHAHLYAGVKQLLSNYKQYEHSHVIGWLETANKQASENMERLSSMHNAALDSLDITALKNLLSEQGVTLTKTEPFYLRADDPPAAWEIAGVKQR